MLKIIIGGIPDLLCKFYNWCLAIMCQILGSLYEFLNCFLATMHQTIDSLCEFLNRFLDKIDGNFLNVLGMIGIALLTVMIPIAVTLITGFAGKKKKFGALDKNIIFKYIVNVEYLLFSIALVYVPILLWYLDIVSSYPILRIIYLILWICGVGIMARMLINASRWHREPEFKFRYDCLKKLKNPREMKESWYSVWEVEDMDIGNEKEFFTIFSSVIDKFFRGNIEKIKIALGLVNDFNSFIDKRSINFLIVPKEIFPKILEWHFFSWQKTNQLINEKNKIDEDVSYSGLSKSLSFALRKEEEQALKEYVLPFFVAFKSHVEKYKKNFVEREHDKKYYYVKVVMLDFFDTLVKNIENRRGIWRHFPSEWKITTENMKKPKNYVSEILYDEFVCWASSRILSSKEYDKDLNNIAYYLFPHVCPTMWANIFTFMLRLYQTDKMKSLIEHPPIFGRGIRPGPAQKGDSIEAVIKRNEYVKQQRKAEEKETISLALLLFDYEFTQDNLKNYITELEALESTHDSERSMEYSRKRYIDIFEKLLKARCKKDAEK